MTSLTIRVACLLPALLVAGFAAAEEPLSLEQRVEQLERQVRALNERLLQEKPAPAVAVPRTRPAYAVPIEEANAPDAPPPPPGWTDPDAWKKLRRSMSKVQVTQLLGEPVRRGGDSTSELWYYPDERAYVEFDGIGEVLSWKRPDGTTVR